MRVLIVEDNEIALEFLRNALAKVGHEVLVARDGLEALEILRTGSCRMVISDWEMPRLNGIQLCREIRARRLGGYVYVILVTARDGTEHVVEGLDAGADDFITKPFQPAELCVRVRAGERMLSLDSRDLIIFSLAKLAESRDPETGAHLERMREYCRVIAQDLSGQEKYADYIDGEYIQTIYLTSPLHDIGKVGIPDSILLKPGRLSDREFAVMKTHTIMGAETLDAAVRQHPEAEFMRMARDIALSHHERFDGSGYPDGLAREDIPLSGRIVALADVYDALTTKRVYKAALSHDVARSIILEGNGLHFDPNIVNSFVQREDDFIAIQQQFTDSKPHTSPEVVGAGEMPP